jgi:chromosome condensin MukBEF ATPase and DNA-binding subunit MukB
MAGQQQTSSRGDTSLEQTLEKTEAVAADVQRASDNLAVVNTVLEQGLPEEVQVGDVAEVNAALSEEIEKRLEATAERDESQAQAEELKARIRAGAAD